MSQKILITGGAGFIGSHLADKLVGLGHQVYILDNFFTGQKENIAHLIDGKRCTLIEHDVVNKFPDLPVNYIYHLACPASPIQYQKNPVETTKTNVIGTINALECARVNKAKILLSSTSEVYGDPLEHPQTESYRGNVNPIGIRACYDEGKRCAETLFFDYHREHGVDIAVARIFNTFGPRMSLDDGRVVTAFITQALSGQDITIFGTGSQTRSFMYIDDLIAGLVKLMNTLHFTGPVNLGGQDEMSIKDLAHEIIKMTDSKSKIIFRDLPEDDPTRRRPSIALAKEKLGWSPKVNWKDGLQRTIKYWLEKK